ncbi:uncharacterized protein N0V89_006539 [Didymosphaeria variabile]|uniref:CCR4-NOT transcription complex subunit 11 n=1 Tax=Didymosphaeria variabile TaxID=1932322 RepID=A0A9W8XJR8_9PLEO|nr:uncharacterized protein N0V89_006539 [Didymosphaeria variabile]KAJ4351200.1 hypothetical protein N0V89_006539 [Didymosphaeria variabile]
MNTAAALTRAEIHALSDADRSCEDANRQLGQAGAHRDAADSGIFEESLRLKNTLDAYETQAKSKPSWEALAVLVNCEYRLYVLNQTTPLRNNPFLSHWVEAVQRLGTPSAQNDAKVHDSITSDEVNTVRMELIKALVQSRNPSQFARASPRQLHNNYVELRQTSLFNMRTYVRMLEEEGIYERTPEPDGDSPKSTASSPAKHSAGKLNEFQRWKLGMLSRLETEPEHAIPELTHLPIELSSLDFLTTLLQENTLQALNIEPAPVIADYIQHALRTMEQMGRGPGETGAAEAEAEVLLESGREAQTRAVKLLLLFMRNLIRKALLPLESIYFEIQEICVRYVWIREVRGLQSFCGRSWRGTR